MTTGYGVLASRRGVISLLKGADVLVVALAFMAALCLALRGADVNAWVDVLQLRVSVQNAIFFSVYLAAWLAILSSIGL